MDSTLMLEYSKRHSHCIRSTLKEIINGVYHTILGRELHLTRRHLSVALGSSPMADAVGARVTLVANKLLQKAQEAQKKGNEAAAKSLVGSVEDLRRAVALLVDQERRLLQQQPAESGVIATTPALCKDVIVRLAKVDAMLVRKSEEMKAKGNANASAALMQAAVSVREGGNFIRAQVLQVEQLQAQNGTLTQQWKQLCLIVSMEGTNATEEEDKDADSANAVLARAKRLVQLEEMLSNNFPDCKDVSEFADAIANASQAKPVLESTMTGSEGDHDAVESLRKECERLQQELVEAKKKLQEEQLLAQEEAAIVKAERDSLEVTLTKLEAEYHERRERELDHLQALYDQQKESHDQLEKLLGIRDEEVSSLKSRTDVLKKENKEQRERMDAFVSDREQEVASYEQELRRLRQYAEERSTTTGTESVDENDSNSSVGAESEELDLKHRVQHAALQKQIEEYRVTLEFERDQCSALRREREEFVITLDDLRKEHEQQLSSLQGKHDEIVKELETLCSSKESEIQIALDKLTILNSIHEEKIKEWEHLNELVSGYQSSCAELQKKVEDQAQTIEALEGKLQAVPENTEHVEDRESFGNDVSSISESMVKHVSEPALVISELAELHFSLDTMNEFKRVLILVLENFEESRRKVDAALSYSKRQEDILDEVYSSIDASLLSNDGLDGSFNDRLHKMKNLIRQLVTDMADLKSSIGDLKMSKELLSGELDILNEAKSELEAECKKVEIEAASFKLQAKTLEEEKEALKRAYEEANTKTMKTRESELQVEIDSQKQRLDAVEADFKRAQLHEKELQDELDLQKQKLFDVESEFERYRTRSHTALKKIEKRAELLNGMRKENERLVSEISAKEQRCAEVEAGEQVVKARMADMERNMEMLRQVFDQQVAESQEVKATFDERISLLTVEKSQSDHEVLTLKQDIEVLEAERFQLSEKIHQLQINVIDPKDEELKAINCQLQEVNDKLASAMKDIASLEQEKLSLQDELLQARELVASLEREFSALKNAVNVKENNDTLAPTSQNDSTKHDKQESAWELERMKLSTELGAARQEVQRLSQLIEDSIVAESSKHFETGSTGDVTIAKLEYLKNEMETLVEEKLQAESTIVKLTAELTRSKELQDRLETQLDSKLSDQLLKDDNTTSKSKEQAVKELKLRILDLEEELQAHREQERSRKQDKELLELKEIQASRQLKLDEHAGQIKLKHRQAIIANYEKKVKTIVTELQQSLEDYSTAFRDACTYRDQHAKLLDESMDPSVKRAPVIPKGPMYSEYLVLNSGVVIKAGSSFQLPVVCEKKMYRVVWTFTVKEETGDVGFTLTDQGKQNVIVPSERVNSLKGVFDVTEPDTTLVFHWDNSFSWLNEKTLDYHVSILEPLTPEQTRVKVEERTLENNAQQFREGYEVLQTERLKRSRLTDLLDRIQACEKDKEAHVQVFEKQKQELVETRSKLQQQMEALKAELSSSLNEVDELEDDTNRILKTWQEAVSEQEDVKMTMQLSDPSQFGPLIQQLEEIVQDLDDKLQELQLQSVVE